MHKFLYYINWVIKCKIKGKQIPLSSSIIITDKCNLTCKHCSVAHLGYENQSFEDITTQISKLYDTGSRMLVITGGEPFIWSFNGKRLEDVVQFSKQFGFFRIVICTNGTFPLNSSADYLWVSVDGAEETHNKIRGKISNTVWENIDKSSHKRIYLNFTISKLNQDSFFIESQQIFKNRKIKGILFHIFTPYVGSDASLLLTKDERIKVLIDLMKLKIKYPIRVSNTYNGIRELVQDRWKRPVWSSILINQGKLVECCCREGIYNKEVCELCGCSPAVETYVLEKLKPLAIIENLRFL